MTNSNFKEKFRHFRSEWANFGLKFINDWSFALSGLIAYNLLISLLPMILCIFTVSIAIFGTDSTFLNDIRDRLVKTFPEQGIGDVVDALLKSVSNQAGLIFLVSFIIAVISGSRLLVNIDDVLTIIYRMRERAVLQQNICAIKNLLAFIVIVPFIIIISTVPAVIITNVYLSQIIVTLCGGVLIFVLFNLIYYFVPVRKMLLKNTWCGSLVATAGLQLLVLLFPLYVHQFMDHYIGQLGFVIIVLILFYLFGVLFVIGAQINAFFFEGIPPLPTGLGTMISQSADRENEQLLSNSIRFHHPMSTLVDE